MITIPKLVRFAMWIMIIMTFSGLLLSGNDGGILEPSGFIPDKPYDIHLLSGMRQPDAGIADADRSLLRQQGQAALFAGQRKVHVLLQLKEIPTPEQVAALSERGILLLEYIPNYTWMAAVPAESPARVLDIPLVRWMGAWPAADKLHPAIHADAWNSYAVHPTQDRVMVVMLLHGDVALERGAALAEAHKGVALPPIAGIHGMTVWLPKTSLLELAAEEEVAWIEEGPAPLSPTNDGVRGSMQIDPLYSAPYSLTGSGVRAFVFDGGTVRTTHNTFNSPGRVTMIDDAANIEDHPTHVAGTLGGDGDGTRAKGVAPGVSILSAEYEQTGGTMLFWDNAGDIQADYATARNSYNMDLGTNSIGSNTASNGYDCAREGDYGVSSNMLDGIVRGDNATVGSPVIMTWANGNERTGGVTKQGECGSNFLTTAPPSCAKNPIHIGAINSDYDSMTDFSSWGPCDDGRMKPVVVASGCELGRASGESYIYSSLATSDSTYGASGWCGTSMATPAAAGVVSLMIEQWRSLGYGGANDRPLPALVKALLMHTARDLGLDGPDYAYGYGEIDAKMLIDLVRVGGGLGSTKTEQWGTDAISQGQTDTFSFVVPAGASELKASLAWDDRAAAAYSATALVNDLNLELVAPDGTTIYYPFTLNSAQPHVAAATGVNTKDNQEQVLVSNPTAGTWTVRVKGTTVPYGPQTYGLVITTLASKSNASCTEQITNSGFESDTSGWTLSGASRVAAPAAGHGSWSLKLGGAVSSTHTAYTQISVPAGLGRAEWTFYWYMTTAEGTYGYGWDNFFAEVRNTSGTVLATYEFRSDGWRPAMWLKAENLDLTPWAGQTVRLYFTAINDSSLATTFYVDDVGFSTCSSLSYTLTVSKPGSGSGTVTSSPAGVSCGGDCSETYTYNTLVTLTAATDVSSTFTGWSGACSGAATTCQVLMNQTRNVTANFTIKTFTLSVTKSGTGTGAPSSSPPGINCGGDCTEVYNYGTLVTLSPNPDVSSTFTGWSGACSGTGSCVVTMDQARAVNAAFTLKTFTLTVTRSGVGAGSVSSSPPGITCGGDCTEVYNYGTPVTLTPAPDPGSIFIGWTGACSGSGACVVTMDQVRSVNAEFFTYRNFLPNIVHPATLAAAPAAQDVSALARGILALLGLGLAAPAWRMLLH